MANLVQVEGGVDVESREFTWTIPNFANVVDDEFFLRSQQLEFQAGESVGLTSKWKVFLGFSILREYVTIMVKPVEQPVPGPEEYLMANCSFGIGGRNGEILVPSRSTGALNWLKRTASGYWNFLLRRDAPNFLVDGSLLVLIAFKIYSRPAPPAFVESFQKVADFNWRIRNFAAVMEEKSLMDMQWFDFMAEDSVGSLSKWKVFLEESFTDRTHFGVYFKLVETPGLDPAQKLTLARCTFSVEGGQGDAGPVLQKTFGPYNMAAKGKESGIGHPKFLKKSTAREFLVNGTLVIRVKFNVYPSPPPSEVQEMMNNLNL